MGPAPGDHPHHRDRAQKIPRIAALTQQQDAIPQGQKRLEVLDLAGTRGTQHGNRREPREEADPGAENTAIEQSDPACKRRQCRPHAPADGKNQRHGQTRHQAPGDHLPRRSRPCEAAALDVGHRRCGHRQPHGQSRLQQGT